MNIQNYLKIFVIFLLQINAIKGLTTTTITPTTTQQRHRKTKELSSFIKTNVLNKLLLNNYNNYNKSIEESTIQLTLPNIIKNRIVIILYF